MRKCKDWKQALVATLDRNFPCTERGNYLEISTPLMFPDGGAISVYIMRNMYSFEVTDLGELFHYLVAHGIDPSLSRTRKQIVDDILTVSSTVISKDEVKCYVSEVESIPFAVFRVAQTVARAADLVYTRQFRIPATFNANVSDFLNEQRIPHIPDVNLKDSFGRSWRFDFQLLWSRPKWVKTIATESKSYGERLVANAIIQWDSFTGIVEYEARVTIYDDTTDVWRRESLEHLARHTQLVPFNRRYEYLHILRE